MLLFFVERHLPVPCVFTFRLVLANAKLCYLGKFFTHLYLRANASIYMKKKKAACALCLNILACLLVQSCPVTGQFLSNQAAKTLTWFEKNRLWK